MSGLPEAPGFSGGGLKCPNLPAHLSLASQTASRLGHTVIDKHLGTFLLGSSSPDIRIMTKWKRDYTHFAPLTVGRIGEGADGLFRTHPGLADSHDGQR